MASSPKHLIVLLLIVLFSDKQINARQSNLIFFSKFVHNNRNENKKPKIDPIPEMPSPATAPAPAPEVTDYISVLVPSLTPSSTESSSDQYSSYGFYGHGLKDDHYFSSTMKMGGENDQIGNEELSADQSFEISSYDENNKSANYYYKNGHVNNYNDISYTNYPDSNDNYERNNNGYDVKNEDSNDHFDESAGRGSSREDQGYYYFSNNEKHEFDSMEEYDRYQKSQKLHS